MALNDGKQARGRRLIQIGLQRTGTNYIATLISRHFPSLHFSGENVWKHAFFDEVTSESLLEGEVLLVARHPVMWLQSCLQNSSKDLRSRRSHYFSEGKSDLQSYAEIYGAFYSEWLRHQSQPQAQVHLVRYEDVLRDGVSHLAKVLDARAQNLSQAEEALLSLPNSVQFHQDDIDAYRRMECVLEEAQAREFWSLLPDDIAAITGYRFEDIRFEGSASLRSIAYAFLKDPGSLDRESFQLLVQNADKRFSQDGEVMALIAQRLENEGELDAAMEWCLRAALAYSRLISAHGFQSGAHFPMADLMERISRNAAAMRLRLIEQAQGYFKSLAPAAGRKQLLSSDRYFYLSSGAKKIGNMEDAIRYARKAVESPDDPGEGQGLVHPWLFHHLGALLFQTGLHEEAVTQFLRAAEGEPHEYRHWLAISHAQLARGEGAAAIQASEKAMVLSPDNGQLLGHHVALLRRFEMPEDAVVGWLEKWAGADPHNALPSYMLSDCHFRAGRQEAALRHAEIATQAPNALPWHFHHHGLLLMREKNFPAAAMAMMMAAEREPSKAAHHYMLGEIRYRLGDIAGAIDAAQAAVDADSPLPWHFHFLGRLQLGAGHLEDARDAFVQAMTLEPGNGEHARALGEVEQRLLSPG